MKKVKWINILTVLVCFVLWLTSNCHRQHVTDNPIFQPGEFVEHRMLSWEGIVIRNNDDQDGPKMRVRWTDYGSTGYDDVYEVEWERQ